MAADIKIQRGVTDVAAGGTTTSITAVGSLNNAFVVLTSNRQMGGGDPASAANHEIDDMSVLAYLSAVDEITFAHPSGSRTCRVYWEVWEYTGPVGGANEFLVRDRRRIAISSGTSGTATMTTTPTDIRKVVPFIAGITSTVAGNGGRYATCRAFCSSTATVNVVRGAASGTTTVAVASVEFTGMAWIVAHGTVTGQTADSGTITLKTAVDGINGDTVDVEDWGKAAIVSWGHAGDGTNDAIADHWPRLEPGANTSSVSYAFDANHDGSDDDITVHVLRHDHLAVTRFTSTANAQGGSNVDITSAGLTDLAESSVLGTVTSSGGGTAYGRGWRIYRLTSLTNAEHWCHRSGNTMQHRLQVLDWSEISGEFNPPGLFVEIGSVTVRVQVNSIAATLLNNPVMTVTGGSVAVELEALGVAWVDDTYTVGDHTLSLPVLPVGWSDIDCVNVRVV